MKKYNLKYLTLILALCIVSNQFIVFADTSNNQGNSTVIISNNSSNSSTELDGEIGEWDPNMDDKPDFSGFNDNDLEGNKPTSDQYFTISATVPISMEFMVLPNSQSALGSFYSPMYKIKNNGSKTLKVKILSFDRDTSSFDRDSSIIDSAPLYIEQVVPQDKKTQMELKLGSIDGTNWSSFTNEVDLTNLDNLRDDENLLCELTMNQERIIKFSSSKWERPEYESKKDSATSNFSATFEFSIK